MAGAVERLLELVDARLARARGVSLADVAGPDPALADPGPELVRHLLDNRAELGAWLAEVDERPERPLAQRLARWLGKRHQFLIIDDVAARELEAALRAVLAELADALGMASDEAATSAITAAFAGLRDRIARFLRARLGAAPGDVVSGEYPPILQLAVLGLTGAPLDEPILDVGCGASAALVRALRADGRDATGIDRDAPSDVATAADWLTFDYGTARWGTVVSHLGFSLHFLRHHLAEARAAYAHAEAYGRILRALRIGGLFAYAPALPFVERVLPGEWQVEHIELRPALREGPVAELEAQTGLPLGRAAHVRRVA